MIVNDKSLEVEIDRLSPQVRYYTSCRGIRQNVSPSVFGKVDIPSDVPTYSMVNVQDIYVSNAPNDFIVPLFINLKPSFSGGSYRHEVTEIDKYRPDLISYDYYETTDYYWVVLLANSILDPFDIEVGTILRLPFKEVIMSQWLT